MPSNVGYGRTARIVADERIPADGVAHKLFGPIATGAIELSLRDSAEGQDLWNDLTAVAVLLAGVPEGEGPRLYATLYETAEELRARMSALLEMPGESVDTSPLHPLIDRFMHQGMQVVSFYASVALLSNDTMLPGQEELEERQRNVDARLEQATASINSAVAIRAEAEAALDAAHRFASDAVATAFDGAFTDTALASEKAATRWFWSALVLLLSAGTVAAVSALSPAAPALGWGNLTLAAIVTYGPRVALFVVLLSAAGWAARMHMASRHAASIARQRVDALRSVPRLVAVFQQPAHQLAVLSQACQTILAFQPTGFVSSKTELPDERIKALLERFASDSAR